MKEFVGPGLISSVLGFFGAPKGAFDLGRRKDLNPYRNLIGQ